MNPVLSVSRKINQKKKDKYNILTFTTHESYQTLLDKTGHNFYLLDRPNCKKWDVSYRPVPPNHLIITQLAPTLDIDFILSQDRFGTLQYCFELQKITRWPIIHMEHVEPQDRWSARQTSQMKVLRGDIEVYITEHNKRSWGLGGGVVVKHGIETDIFKGWKRAEKPYVLYVVNDLVNRDYFCGYHEWKKIRDTIQLKYPEVEFKLVGHNGELGRPAKNLDELIALYQGAACYLNTSKLSPVPMSILEAMSVGCPVVSTANQEVPNIVKHLKTGICSNDLEILIDGILDHLHDRMPRLGPAGRQFICENYGIDQFIKHWNLIFKKAFIHKLGYACSKVLAI